MPDQLQLAIFRAPAASPVTDERLSRFVGLLEFAEDWLTAKQIARRMILDDRQIRELAEHSTPHVISGDKGYRHTDRATPEEIRHFVKRMESQGKRMIDRAEKVRRYAHSRIG